MYPLEPNRHVWYKRHIPPQPRRDLPLMDMIRETVRNEVIPEILDIILRTRFRARARVSRDAEHGRLPAQMVHQRRDTHLRSCGVAPWVRDARGFGDLGSVDEFRETVGPVVVEAVVRAKVHDDAFAAADFINGIDEGFADTVGERHDPAVDVAFFFHAADIVWAEVFVGDIALVVAFELLTGEFTRGDVAEVHVRVVVEDFNECLDIMCQYHLEILQ